MKAGVTLNPSTPVNVLEDIIGDIDIVQLMSVNPGFGGQSFITHAVKKVQKLKALIEKEQCNTLIEVDGGVNGETAPLLVNAGTDILVSGSYIFGSKDPYATIAALKGL